MLPSSIVMFFALCTGSVAVAQPAPVVGVTGGLVQGEMVDGMAVYLGIPYAQPPVGPLRWAAPLPPVPWTGVKNATAFAPSCVQTNAAGSEDCLYVNVFVPPGLPAPAPVMVFIHGGGFVSGSAQINAISYANLSQFIIVTLQYRLNILGYMAVEGMSPALPKTPGAATFNVGLQDQQMALWWASNNAAAFGGDASHILLSGQSAGGMSVMYQLTIPGSYGAYQAAMPQSPGALTVPIQQAYALSARVAADPRVNCNVSDFAARMACLRAVPIATLEAAAISAAGTGDLPLLLGPCLDGTFVTASPGAKFLSGDFNLDATILIGGTLFEGDALLIGYEDKVVFDQADYISAIQQMGRENGLNNTVLTMLQNLYAPLAARDNYYNASTRVWGDGLIECNIAWVAAGVAAHSHVPGYRYLYNTTFPQSGGAQPAGRATHSTDMLVLFNALAWTPAETALLFEVHGYLANVVRTRDPNAGFFVPPVKWPRYDPSGMTTIVFKETDQYTFIKNWHEEYCDTWFQLLP